MVWGICESRITERPSSIEMHREECDLDQAEKIADACMHFTTEFCGPWGKGDFTLWLCHLSDLQIPLMLLVVMVMAWFVQYLKNKSAHCRCQIGTNYAVDD